MGLIEIKETFDEELYKDSSAEGASGRDRIIIRTSVIGILANVLLAAFKAVVGLLTHSIAIVLDAVNNFSDAASSVANVCLAGFKAVIGLVTNSIAIVLEAVNNISDAGSSLITIVGTKLAGKAPDKKHPFGYGRIEYLSAMVISLIVLYAGITSFTESARKILHPDTPEYTVPALVIVAAGVLVKVLLGRFVKSTGEKVNSDSLVNSGEDATLDSVISASTLAAAAIYLWKGISLEDWLGAVISVIIIKSGIGMLRETLSKVLGERADADLSKEIKQTVRSFPGVGGAYDLILHNYGPDAYNGSIHIEVPDTLSAGELDVLTREITAEVYRKHKVILTAISVYSVNTKDPGITKMRAEIGKTALDQEYVMQMHGFYVDQEARIIRFDLVISFDAPDRAAVCAAVYEKLKKQYPDYQIQITPDVDFS